MTVEGAANLDAIVTRQGAMLRPPPVLRLSEWADRHYVISRESSADPGQWKTRPYQRAFLDAVTDPRVEFLTVQKSARVGFTACLNIALAYHIAEDPCPILVYHPTVEDARRYSRKEIAPMLRDVPRLAGLVREPRARESGNTILDKEFPGGSLELNGAVSPSAFRARTAKVVIFDEADGFPPSAGDEGDQFSLGEKRSATFRHAGRKVIAVSTPATQPSRIEQRYLEGDQRRYFVPCPHCGHFDELVWQQEVDGEGHYLTWPEGRPDEAAFVCSASGCVITHEHKRDMVERGEWRAREEFRGHASFFIWSAYGYQTDWAQIAEEHEKARARAAAGDQEALKSFYNTVLGLSWKVVGEAPEWRRLYDRRESYAIGSVPAGVKLLTAGVDVQKDRLVYEVVGWGASRESWSIEAGEIAGDTSGLDGAVWGHLDTLLVSSWTREDGAALTLAVLGIDSGYNTQVVYSWARRHGDRVMATKGQASASAILSAPRRVAVTMGGRLIPDGCKLWIVGVSIAKQELYGWLRLERGDGGGAPAGYCHFPEHGEEYFRQLTAEQLVTVRKRTGYTAHEWQLLPGRQNHWLDARIIARAVTAPAQIDWLLRSASSPPARPGAAAPSPRPVDRPAAPAPPRDPWLDGGADLRSRRGGSFWR